MTELRKIRNHDYIIHNCSMILHKRKRSVVDGRGYSPKRTGHAHACTPKKRAGNYDVIKLIVVASGYGRGSVAGMGAGLLLQNTCTLTASLGH